MHKEGDKHHGVNNINGVSRCSVLSFLAFLFSPMIVFVVL